MQTPKRHSHIVEITGTIQCGRSWLSGCVQAPNPRMDFGSAWQTQRLLRLDCTPLEVIYSRFVYRLIREKHPFQVPTILYKS